MMLHRHFDEPDEEPKHVEAETPDEAKESGETAEGADIVTDPVQTKPKRTTRKKTAGTK